MLCTRTSCVIVVGVWRLSDTSGLSNHKKVLLYQITTVRSFKRCIPRSQTSPCWITAAILIWPEGFRTNWMPCDWCSSILHIACNCDFHIFGPLQKVHKGHAFMLYNGLGRTPRNSLQLGYLVLFINGTLVSVPVVVCSNCHSALTCQHLQVGFSCACLIYD